MSRTKLIAVARDIEKAEKAEEVLRRAQLLLS